MDPTLPGQALPQLRAAQDELTRAMDEAMALVIVEEGSSIRTAGQLAGLSENAVGPRLTRTTALAAYVGDTGRVTASGVERARVRPRGGTTPHHRAHCRVTLAQFDTEYEEVYRDRAVGEVPPLVLQPRGMTALLDSIGHLVGDAHARVSARAGPGPSSVIVGIMTDGPENSSRELSHARPSR